MYVYTRIDIFGGLHSVEKCSCYKYIYNYINKICICTISRLSMSGV